MHRTKYVIVEDDGFLVPILFSYLLEHSKFKDWHPVSAGFVDVNAVIGLAGRTTIEVSVFGRSYSLGIAAMPSDAELIRKSIVWYED